MAIIKFHDVENHLGELWRIYDADVDDEGVVNGMVGQRMIFPLECRDVFNFWSTVRVTFDAGVSDEEILESMRKLQVVLRDVRLA